MEVKVIAHGVAKGTGARIPIIAVDTQLGKYVAVNSARRAVILTEEDFESIMYIEEN